MTGEADRRLAITLIIVARLEAEMDRRSVVMHEMGRPTVTTEMDRPSEALRRMVGAILDAQIAPVDLEADAVVSVMTVGDVAVMGVVEVAVTDIMATVVGLVAAETTFMVGGDSMTVDVADMAVARVVDSVVREVGAVGVTDVVAEEEGVEERIGEEVEVSVGRKRQVELFHVIVNESLYALRLSWVAASSEMR